jgi:hypothetical protein
MVLAILSKVFLFILNFSLFSEIFLTKLGDISLQENFLAAQYDRDANQRVVALERKRGVVALDSVR